MPENNQKFLDFIKKILKKLRPRFSFHYVAYTTLFFLLIFSFISLTQATTPNPGHPWSQLGDGVFVFTNSQTVTPYTYTFPAANTSVLTTDALVTVPQGGTGVGTLTGMVKGNGASAFSVATEGTDYSAGTSALATGILKSTTTSGALSIASAGDFPTLDQDTTGKANKADNLTGGDGTTLLGAMPYQSGVDTTTLLSPNTTSTKKYLSMTGTGTNGVAPVWDSAPLTAWDTIADPTGNGAIDMGSTVQSMDWSTTTTTNPLSLTAVALTTGNLLSLSSNTLTSGSLLNISSAGTDGLTNQKGLNIALSGTNGTSAQTTYGAYISNIHDGITSTNVGLYATASGGTTANYAAIFNGGNVGIGTTSPLTLTEIRGGLTTVGAVLTLGTKETSVVDGDVLGKINFYAPLAGTGDAILLGASIWAEADATFSTTVNSTELVFATGTTAIATEKMRIDKTGNVGIGIANPLNILHVYSTGTANNISIDGNANPAMVLRSSGVIKGYSPIMVTANGSFFTDALAGDMGFRSESDRILFGVGSGLSMMTVNSTGVNIAGNVGIGITIPTAVLHLKAGTSTANTAPLKLTSGTLLGTAEAGAIEFLTDAYYGTITTGEARKQFAFTSDITGTNSGTNTGDQVGDGVTITGAGTALDPFVSVDGSVAWDTIADPTGNGAIDMGSTVQSMDWSTTTTTNPLSLTAVALTTGNLLSLSSNTLTSGSLLNISSAGTDGLTNQKGLNIALSGTNGTSAQTTYGAYISNIHDGITSTNVGLYATASGGTTDNYAGIFDQGRVLIGATTDSTSSSHLYISGTTATNGSSSAIAGILGNYTFNPTAGGVQVGNRFVVTNSPTTNVNTAANQLIRVVDNTALANTVYGIDVTANAGSNTAGINTGIRANAATFGVQGITSGLGGGASVPAALFGQNTGTTQGDILRLYSQTVTSATSFANFYHDTSTFTGTGLLMKFATSSGTFSGNFVDFQKNNVSLFKVTNAGILSIGLSATVSTTAVCSSLAPTAAPAAGTAYELQDCSGAPVADYAEMYPIEKGIEYGDIVTTGSEIVNTYDVGTDGNIDWNVIKGNVSKLTKSNGEYQDSVIGIVSDNRNDFSSTGYNIKDTDNPMPVALNGRVPVKISDSSAPIKAGDYLTTSAESGKTMKALKSGFVIGKALEDWDPSTGKNTIMLFVEQGYYQNDSLHEFSGETTFNGLTYFNSNVEFAQSIKFNDVAEFTVPPLFNSDTAGFAVIKAGDNKVDVVFDKPYLTQPVVTASITLENNGTNMTDQQVANFFGEDIKSVVVNKSQYKFTIQINKVASEDIKFSWIALAVKDPKIFESVISGLIIEPTTIPISPSISTSSDDSVSPATSPATSQSSDTSTTVSAPTTSQSSVIPDVTPVTDTLTTTSTSSVDSVSSPATSPTTSQSSATPEIISTPDVAPTPDTSTTVSAPSATSPTATSDVTPPTGTN